MHLKQAVQIGLPLGPAVMLQIHVAGGAHPADGRVVVLGLAFVHDAFRSLLALADAPIGKIGRAAWITRSSSLLWYDLDFCHRFGQHVFVEVDVDLMVGGRPRHLLHSPALTAGHSALARRSTTW